MKISVYKIGKVNIEIQMPEEMLMPENMDKFLVKDSLEEPIAMRYYLEFTDDIIGLGNEMYSKKVPGKEAVRNNIRVFQTAEGECRFMSLIGADIPYAVTLQGADKITKVWFWKEYERLLSHDTVFDSALSLEKLMIASEALILHSAYINYHGKAVLFSAPSETGKSTQANLWEKYRGTYTVNGDRSLLIREPDGWYAYGWPICGSSGICRNEIYPVQAIVMLKQAKENKAFPLKGIQALREVMGQITINGWDADFQMKAMDGIERLLEEVPVYRLECDISEHAVECLEKALA